LAQLEELVVLHPKAWQGRWHELFGNDRPIHVELGMGKGQFVSEMSLRYPAWNFVGIDMYDELIRKGSEKIEQLRAAWSTASSGGSGGGSGGGIGGGGGSGGKQPPNNLRLALGNIEGIEEMFAPAEIERIYLNFSDPWPKTRHAHRRLTHQNFLMKYKQILNQAGEIHLKTDSRSLFEFSLNTFAELELMLRNISLDLHADGTAPNNVMTEYEEKFHKQGLPIYRTEVILGVQAMERRRQA
jgi:tRNA (guanine-N7-)-methyltransferase